MWRAPSGGRHRLVGHDDDTEELPIVTHADTPEGRADDYASCSGENRAEPNSWADTDIVDAPWRDPEFIEPAAVTITTEEV